MATCDNEIAQFALAKKIPYRMTANTHVRCLDRVAEAIKKSNPAIATDDIVVCVQGDEPMLHPKMIAAVIKPIEENHDVYCTMLAMSIVDEAQFKNADIVKIIHDMKGDVLYTAEAPCRIVLHSVWGMRRKKSIWNFCFSLAIFTEI